MNIVLVYSIILSMLMNFVAPRVDLGGGCSAALGQAVRQNVVVSCAVSVLDLAMKISNMMLHPKTDDASCSDKTTPKHEPSKAKKASEFSIILEKYKIYRQHIVLPVLNLCILPQELSLRAGLQCFVLQRIYFDMPSICPTMAYFARSDTADAMAFSMLLRFPVLNPAF